MKQNYAKENICVAEKWDFFSNSRGNEESNKRTCDLIEE